MTTQLIIMLKIINIVSPTIKKLKKYENVTKFSTNWLSLNLLELTFKFYLMKFKPFRFNIFNLSFKINFMVVVKIMTTTKVQIWLHDYTWIVITNYPNHENHVLVQWTLIRTYSFSNLPLFLPSSINWISHYLY